MPCHTEYTAGRAAQKSYEIKLRESHLKFAVTFDAWQQYTTALTTHTCDVPRALLFCPASLGLSFHFDLSFRPRLAQLRELGNYIRDENRNNKKACKNTAAAPAAAQKRPPNPRKHNGH